jgi:hypothetical protein
MMIKRTVLYARKHAKQFLSIEVITCVIVFVVGSAVGHAIVVGMS